jgi:hypothetical protein
MHQDVEYRSLILELHLTLSGMDVHIHRVERDGKKHNAQRKTAGGQQFTVPATQGKG